MLTKRSSNTCPSGEPAALSSNAIPTTCRSSTAVNARGSNPESTLEAARSVLSKYEARAIWLVVDNVYQTLDFYTLQTQPSLRWQKAIHCTLRQVEGSDGEVWDDQRESPGGGHDRERVIRFRVVSGCRVAVELRHERELVLVKPDIDTVEFGAVHGDADSVLSTVPRLSRDHGCTDQERALQFLTGPKRHPFVPVCAGRAEVRVGLFHDMPWHPNLAYSLQIAHSCSP